MKRISILVLALAFAGCATQPKTITSNPEVSSSRTIASSHCSPEPCVAIESFNGSQAVFVGQGFSKSGIKSFQVNIYANPPGQAPKEFLNDINTNADGSFSYTTPSGKATYGTKMEVKVLNWEGSGKHWVGTATIAREQEQRQGKQGGQSSGGNGGNGNQRQDPPEYQMDYGKLTDYAVQQARTVANRVAKTYGALENWKYNFAMGYWDGVSSYANSYEARVERDNGLMVGRSRGGDPGYDAGKRAGAGDGNQNGRNIARARFLAIVNSPNAPDVSAESVDPAVKSAPRSYDGVAAPKNACDGVTSRQAELERQLSTEMRVIRFGDDDYGYLTYEEASYSITFRELNRWGSGKYEFIDSWFRNSYAWKEWIENDLGGRYDKVNYRKLNQTQANQFRREFENEYDRSIKEKYYNEKTRPNAVARIRGQWFGEQVTRKQVFDAGCNTGYAETYTPASIRGYGDSYTDGFMSGFKSIVRQYNAGPILTIEGIRLVDGNQNGAFELGESLGIEVGKVTNIGRVAARNIPVKVSGEGLTSTASSETFSVEPSTSQVINKQIMNLATIRGDVIADKDNAVSVSVGTESQSLSYNVSWKGAIQALLKVDPARATSLKNFVLKNIQDEYRTTESAENNIYKDGDSSKMLDLVELYERSPASERAVIRSMGPTIVTWHTNFEDAHNKWTSGKTRKAFAALAARIK